MSPLSSVRKLGDYAHQLLEALKDPDNLPEPELPTELPLVLTDTAKKLASSVAHALINKCVSVAGWDIQRRPDELAAKVIDSFPNPADLIKEPVGVVDGKGRIAGVIIPDALVAQIRTPIKATFTKLREEFNKAAYAPADFIPDENERYFDRKQFYDESEKCRAPRGSVHLSPASEILKEKDITFTTPLNTPFKEWVSEWADYGPIMSVLLALVHYELFVAGCDALVKLEEQTSSQAVKEAMKEWPFVFAAVSIVGNRQSPPHLEPATSSSQPPWFDVLMSIGGDRNRVLELQSLNLRIRWNPGSVAIFNRRLIISGISHSIKDQLLVLGYMRDEVFDGAGFDVVGSVKIEKSKEVSDMLQIGHRAKPRDPSVAKPRES